MLKNIKNSIDKTHPKLILEWDFKKNNKNPFSYTYGSNKKVWWVCYNNHSFESKIYHRTIRKQGCPYCSGQKVCEDNSLEKLYPEIAQEWHSNKNGSLTPKKVTRGTTRSVWWLCDKGHEYKTGVSNRTLQKNGCPYCSGRRVTLKNSLSARNPEISKQWHPTKNGELTPDKVTSKSGKKVWWLCLEGHSYDMKVYAKNRPNIKCPYCSGHRVCKDNCLETKYPELVKEWDYNKNKLNPYEVTYSSNKRAWWVCNKGHSFETRINHRTAFRKSGCPYCSNKKVCWDNCLGNLYPKISKEWHPTKNGDLSPRNVIGGSDRKVWWLCNRGHTYKSRLAGRTTGGHGCSQCLYKTQEKCREIFENYFKKPFKTKKPKYLEGLELDGYNEYLKLAFEYDGEWHYRKVLPNRSQDELEKQKKRDDLKNTLCLKNKVTLIRIPFYEKNNLEIFILKKIKEYEEVSE